jgi:dGTPase
LKIVAKRAEFIVSEIMSVLSHKGGAELLPHDFQTMYSQAAGTEDLANHDPKSNSSCMRVLCDYVAGMTDKYCAEFFSKLRSENYQTIFRDH